jgi:hypothetical protein
MKWQTMGTAPKDKMVLLDIGFPWAVIGIYNEYAEEWIYPELQCSPLEESGKIFDDVYFENEFDKAPLFWMPLPDIKSKKK